jgi:hypothetical protein
MLSLHPQDLHQASHHPFRAFMQSPTATANFAFFNHYTFHHSSSAGSMGGDHIHYQDSNSPPPSQRSPAPPSTGFDSTVEQALEIARDSPEGAADPTISSILDSALNQLWAKVQAAPDSYVMTRDEFAVFNYFQHRFTGNKMAIAARKRFWDNVSA